MSAYKSFVLEVINSIITHFKSSEKSFRLTFDGSNIEYNTILPPISSENSNRESESNSITNSITNSSPEIDTQNRSAPKSVTGVTLYIRDLQSKQLTIPFINHERFSTIDIVPYCDRRRFQSAFELLTQLHRIDPRLNGVCMEGLLYQAIGENLHPDLNPNLNSFSAVSNSNIMITHEFDFSFMTTIQAVIHKLQESNMTEIDIPIRLSYSSIDEISTLIPDKKYFGYSEASVGLILYLISYAYISAERRGFTIDNYSTDDIISYANCLIENFDKFNNLCDYMKEVVSTMKTIRSQLHINIEEYYENVYIPDIEIRPIETKSKILHGDVDILETYSYEGGNYIVNDLPLACLYDIKCCKSEDKYIREWPMQLNLYRLGLKRDYEIQGLFIINIMTNHIIKYNICDGDMQELE